MNELHLFAGAGGGILGGMLLGHTCVCAVEIEPYPRKVLLQRQRDGILPRFPIWDDILTFDGTPWRGKVDVVCGGFPCQDISAAGKGAGIEGERSGLWGEMARVISEVRPRHIFIENSPLLVGRGLAVVLCDLAKMGYDARWGIVGAHHASAPHRRDRIWIMAHSNRGDAECRQSQRSRVWAKEVGQGANDNPCRSGQRFSDVANAAGSQDDGIRGDCECGRNTMERSEQAPQQEHGQTDHHRACGCGEDVADPNHNGASSSERSRILCGSEQDAGRKKKQDGTIQPAGSDSQPALPSNVADSAMRRCEEQWEKPNKAANTGEQSLGIPDTNSNGCNQGRQCVSEAGGNGSFRDTWWATEPDVGRVAHGVGSRVDRLKAAGNGQVPAVAALAWRILSGDDNTSDTKEALRR